MDARPPRLRREALRRRARTRRRPGRSPRRLAQRRAGDGRDALRARAREPSARRPTARFDLTFLDAEREAYVGYWPDLVRPLAPSGLLAVDNVVSHAGQVEAFRAVVGADERVTQALVPIGAGVLLAVRG